MAVAREEILSYGNTKYHWMEIKKWFWSSKASFLLIANKNVKCQPASHHALYSIIFLAKHFLPRIIAMLLLCIFFSTKSSWWEFKFLKTWNVAVFLLRSKRVGSMCTQMPIYFPPKLQNFYSIKTRKESHFENEDILSFC